MLHAQLLVRDRVGPRDRRPTALFTPHRARRAGRSLFRTRRRRLSWRSKTAAATAWRRCRRAGGRRLRALRLPRAKFDATGSLHRGARPRARAARRRACAPIRSRVQEQVAVRVDGRSGARRRAAAAGQLLLRPPGVEAQAGLPALRHPLPADLRQPARFLAPELRAREDARRLARDRAGACRRSSNGAAAASASRASVPDVPAPPLLPARCATSTATSTAGSSTTSCCPARC